MFDDQITPAAIDADDNIVDQILCEARDVSITWRRRARNCEREGLLMIWSKRTTDALHRWLGPSTWYKGHPFDDARFYVFVASVWNDGHQIWSECEACEMIRQTAAELHPAEIHLANDVAKRRVQEGTSILDFLSQIGDQGRFDLLSPPR